MSKQVNYLVWGKKGNLMKCLPYILFNYHYKIISNESDLVCFPSDCYDNSRNGSWNRHLAVTDNHTIHVKSLEIEILK